MKVTTDSIAPTHLNLIALRATLGTNLLKIKIQVKKQNNLPNVTIKMISTRNKTIFKADSTKAKAKLIALEVEAETL